MKTSKKKSPKRKEKSAPGLTERLRLLLAERQRRAALRAASERLAQIKPVSASMEGEFEETWRAEREEFARLSEAGVDMPGGMLANVLEGLTPSGRDRQGRQVSFVEYGRPGQRPRLTDRGRPLRLTEVDRK